MNAIASPKLELPAIPRAPQSPRPPAANTGKRKSSAWRWITFAVFPAALIASLLFARSLQYRALATRTVEMSIPTVGVVHPQPGPATFEISLPANLGAYNEASLFARTNGYLKAWHTDFGDTVKEGQLMAEISAPDVDAQLNKAKADLVQAQANLEIARITFQRQKELLSRKVVSQQEYDQSHATFDADAAAVNSAEANVENLTVQQGFQKIVAPFPGIVTRRGTDLGDLITTGSDAASAGGKELFHLVRTNILRVFVNVPQVYSSQVTHGMPASVKLVQFPGETFAGKIVNISGALDPATRTLAVEVQVPNPDGRLFPGAYGEVQFTAPIQRPPLVIPANTLLFRKEGLQVGVVDNDGRVLLKPVTLGRDFGATVEIVAGLHPGDAVITNPSDSLTAGTKVNVAPPASENKANTIHTKQA